MHFIVVLWIQISEILSSPLCANGLFIIFHQRHRLQRIVEHEIPDVLGQFVAVIAAQIAFVSRHFQILFGRLFILRNAVIFIVSRRVQLTEAEVAVNEPLLRRQVQPHHTVLGIANLSIVQIVNINHAQFTVRSLVAIVCRPQ